MLYLKICHMKKTLYFIGIIIIFTGCKFEEKPFAFVREYDEGKTFLTSYGAAKYISADSTILVFARDVYAEVKDSVEFNKNEVDSIIMYGHCWSEEKDPTVHISSSTRYMVDNNDDLIPDGYVENLGTEGNETFTSTIFNLKKETYYYVRGYIITGDLEIGTQSYDTAYNQRQRRFQTEIPRDQWEIRQKLHNWKGAVSFVHDNILYVGMGHNGFDIDKEIWKYDPSTNLWEIAGEFQGTLEISGSLAVTNAVAFVIEDVTINNTPNDYVYIGTGYCLVPDGSVFDTTAVGDFWRWDFGNQWEPFTSVSIFPGYRQNAVAFSVGKYGYVGLGSGRSGESLPDFFRLDPEDWDVDHIMGSWKPVRAFPGSRTQAISFVLGDNAFVGCGRDGDENGGTYYNDLYMYAPSEEGEGAWIRKEDFIGTPRIEAVGMAVDMMGYVGTGQDIDSLRSDFYRYNPYIDEWEQKAWYGGVARAEAIGEGLEFQTNDYRGYLGLGRVLASPYLEEDFWVYRP